MPRVVLALALGLIAFAAPRAVVACTCEPWLGRAEVIFTGVVTDSPNRSVLFRDFWEGERGVYTFDVQSVTRGDPLDGRVWTSYGYGGCGRIFELGATYEVHANVVDPEVGYPAGPPEASLVTGICADGVYLGAADMAVVIRALAFTPEGILVGLVVVAGVGTFAWRRHRSSRDMGRSGGLRS